MSATTIKIHKKTKAEIDKFREYKSESYDEVLKKLVFIAKKLSSDPKISKETINQIQKARKRIQQGNFVTEEEARKRLGLKNVPNNFRQKSNKLSRKTK